MEYLNNLMRGLRYRDLIKGAFAALVLVFLSSPCAVLGQTDRPNIIVLFADDLGYGDISYNGGDIPTPNIDALVAEGVRFSSGYMTAPLCNPARAGLITGRYQQRWGQELNTQKRPPEGAPGGAHLPRSQTTLATALKAQGYATGIVGKWQLGDAEGHHPLDRGFDSFFGFLRVADYVDTRWPDVHYIEYPSPAGAVGGPKPGPKPLMSGREVVPLEEHMTEKLTREGVAFIKRHKAEPFFLYLSQYAPHTPIQTTKKYYDRFPQFENETKRIYAAMVSAVDDGVGTIMDTLKKEGLLENTLVFFTSDNGAAEYSDMDGKRNYPLTGHKRNLYEGGTRVPFAVHWPGVLPEGKTYEKLVSSLDIFPTALAAAGVAELEGYDLDGANLLPYLKGTKKSDPHEYLFWRSGPNAAARKGKWKLLMAGEELTRLYNVDKDPSETKDFSGQKPELVKEMKQAFRKWNSQLPEPRKANRKVTTEFNGDTIEWDI